MKLPKTQTVVFANQKGGCGKTTGSVSVAAALARLGYTTTIVDIDPQCNATDSFGVNRDELAKQRKFSVADAYMSKVALSNIQITLPGRFNDNLTVVPGYRGLSSVQPRLEAEMHGQLANEQSSDLDADDLRNEQRARLRSAITSLQGKQDFVVIDTPPDLGFLLTTALIAADWYIIPVFPSGYDLRGLETLARTVEKVRERYNPTLRLLGVLIGNFDPRAKLDRDIQQMLGEKFGGERIFSIVNRSVKHREAPIYGLTIFEHQGGEQGSEQYEQVAREVIERIEKALNITSTMPAKAEEEEIVEEVANG